MKHTYLQFETWQLTQLARIARQNPNRIEMVLNALWQASPGLFEDLAIAAVDQEMLSIQECAEKLGLTEAGVESKLREYRRSQCQYGAPIVRDLEHGCVAKLSGSQIAIWEIVRAHRKLGSLEAVQARYPGIDEIELQSALAYAEENPVEIEAQIRQYDEMRARKQVEYPFADRPS
ncbi:MAG TPA: hypothetical protein PLO61_07405 [Fimbriimonadaceae bacterium]|nr:hypothetical protein [Fimbriimonadaceae bacterium]HRJ32953.1 hypothetical protein [Fimbriimonadaceae bacterium]